MKSSVRDKILDRKDRDRDYPCSIGTPTHDHTKMYGLRKVNIGAYYVHVVQLAI